VLNAGSPYQSTNGTPLANSTTATDISPAPQLTVPANFYYVGQLWRARAWGIYSTTGTPNLTIGFYYGGAAGTALAATAATATGAAVSNLMWHAEATFRVTSLGASGTILGFGLCHGIAATASTPVLMPTSSSSGNSVTINTTTANTWTCGATWGTSNTSNTITCYFFQLELLT
jgi:hypothetical protein